MCLFPKLIKNKKYSPNRKNKGVVPEIKDERTLYVPVGCGKCMECMKQKKRLWQVRMLEEIKANRNGVFVTLTFNNESLIKLEKDIEIKNSKAIIENEVATLAVRRFLERWRKKFKVSVRHWLVTELGHINTERIHLHGVIFTDEIRYIVKLWQYGHVTIGKTMFKNEDWENANSNTSYVNGKTINYIVKYINKIDVDHKGYIPKILRSKGIGNNYLKGYNSERNKFNGKNTREFYITEQGYKINLPIYYRNKIYNDDEREKLWLNKLDGGKRFVCGEMVKDNDEKNYFKLLDYYRKENSRLGYGDDSKEWSRDAYLSQKAALKGLRNLNKNKDKINKLLKDREIRNSDLDLRSNREKNEFL